MKAVQVYAKNIFLRFSIMKGEIELHAPTDKSMRHAVTFFVYALAIGVMVRLAAPVLLLVLQ